MATISNTPRPGYVWDSTDNVWYPIGTGPHTHADYITSGSAINPTIVDAKGDIIAATAADTVARLAVGANDTVLTADSSTATGLKWAAASSGLTLISNTAFTTQSSVSLAANTFSATYTNYKIILDITAFSASNTFIARMRASGTDYSGNQYLNQYVDGSGATASASDTATNTSISLGDPNTNVNYQLEMELFKPNVASRTWAISKQYFYDSTGYWHIRMQGNRVDTTTQYDSMSIIPSTGTMTGRIFVYGYAI